MKYVKTSNGCVVEYPYSIAKLKQDNPNVSFPYVVDESLLASYGVFAVHPTNLPNFNQYTQICKLGNPIFLDDKWIDNWEITPASSEEIEKNRIQQSLNVRNVRSYKLQTSDWTRLDDNGLTSEKKSEWAQYRQQLRDISDQEGFPFEVTWPTPPA